MKYNKFFIGSFILIAISVGFILLAGGCDDANHVEALEGYTKTGEQFIEQADLVEIDGYYVGTGTLNDIQHARFLSKKDDKISDTIDVTSKFFKIVYTDDASSKDKDLAALNGKVKAYQRTYKKGNSIKTHYYYVLYTTKSKVKDCGELSTDSSEDDSDSEE